MAGLNPYKLHSFAEFAALGGPIYVICYGCARYVILSIRQHGDRDSRHTTFSCCVCGTAGHVTQGKPIAPYREDARSEPRRHPGAVARITGRSFRPSRAHDLRRSGEKKPTR